MPIDLIPNVVYESTCSLCNHRYIRETARNLTLRIAKHKGICAGTGARLFNPSLSPIRSHSYDLDHAFSEDNFKFLMKACHPYCT